MLFPRELSEDDWAEIITRMVKEWKAAFEEFVAECPAVRSSLRMEVYPRAFPRYEAVRRGYWDVNGLATEHWPLNGNGEWKSSVAVGTAVREVGKIVTNNRISPMMTRRRQAATSYEQELKV